jgi:uncharacterized membrane protein YuzA (DUF378 family)
MRILTSQKVYMIAYGLTLAGALNLGASGLIPADGTFGTAVFFGKLAYLTAGLAAIYIIWGKQVFRNDGVLSS